jgi:glyoxylase-like metal-dependent hydrolase (beta-lactamase superfamily II)
LLDGTASLFAGDNILGEGTAVIAPPDGNMSDYMDTLLRLSGLHIDRIYTGHFKPLHGGAAIIDGYIAHRRARESAIVHALEAAGRPLSVEEIVELVYAEVAPQLHPIARFSVTAHLEMLADLDRVSRSGELWTTRSVG